ncbi:S53 family peptidase [Catenulispora rubra]|uniref:S53 family peptidase n=1 Tax=Catenulispora rubra TaxID=280293 RepID=UPI00189249FE|nr:S53 family peptidase [Catenulispora rubra]
MRTNHISLTDDDPNYIGPEKCSDYYGELTARTVPNAFGGRNPLAVCGYTPEQLRFAYGVTQSHYRGKGVTVAVVDAYASPTMLADANHYAMNHDERLLSPSQYREVTPPAYHHLTDGECETPANWAVEEALDVEAVHAMAPQANIVYVAAASCDDTDLMAALQTVVDDHLATVVSDSWGGIPHSTYGDEDPATMAGYSALFQRGGQQGISFLFSTGDCGAEDPAAQCASGSARPQTEYPAQDPWVTAVGGTSLAIGPWDQYVGEVGWGDRRSSLAPNGTAWAPSAGTGQWRFGGGGGTSEDVPQPSYQAGVVPQALATTLLNGKPATRPMRTLPDVAMDADPMTGFLTGVTQKLPNGTVGYAESTIGGTSLATPLFAGVMADAEQAAGHPFGFLNPALYGLAATGAFHDVTPTSLGADSPRPGTPPATVVDLGLDGKGARQARLYQLGDDGLLTAGTGYDDVTGLGSPSKSYLRSWK